MRERCLLINAKTEKEDSYLAKLLSFILIILVICTFGTLIVAFSAIHFLIKITNVIGFYAILYVSFLYLKHKTHIALSKIKKK